jgi:hypothetical protein
VEFSISAIEAFIFANHQLAVTAAQKKHRDALEKCMTDPSFATIAGACLGEIV